MIKLQSSFFTQFNNVSYDKLVGSIIITVDSDDNLQDIIVVSMPDSSFRVLLADGKNIEPSDVLALFDGQEQEYYASNFSSIYVLLLNYENNKLDDLLLWCTIIKI